jgi:TonB family protein
LNPTTAAARSVAAGAGASAGTAAVGAGSASASASTMAAVIAAAAPPVMPPAQVPLSREPALPVAMQAPVTTVRPRVLSGLARERAAAPRETLVLPNYVIPLFAAALVVIALILIPFVLRHRVTPQAAPVVSSVAPSAARPASLPDASPSTSNAQPVVPANAPPAKTVAEATPPVTPAPAAPPHDKDSSRAVSKPSSVSAGKGEVLDQATPEASAKALATIHGTVHVAVKVHVDAAGNVSDAALDPGGPSRYFADLSLKAARQWVFTPPEADGKSVPSDWKIQFRYTRSGVQMNSEQVTP